MLPSPKQEGKKMAGSDSARRTPSLPWTVRVQLAALGAAHRRDGSVRRLLFSLGDLHAAARPRPDASGVRSADVTIDASRGLWARVFSPSSAAADAPLPVVVYFHGGGFVLFSAASRPYDALCRRLCRELGAVVVSVNYRLAPQHRFPAAYDDGVATLRYLDVNALPADLAAVPVDLSSCFLAGDSAGGNIVHHVAQRWASMPATSPPVSVRVAGAVLIQPFFGGEERTGAEVALDRAIPSLSMAVTDHFWREFLPEGATRDHEAARVCDEGVELAEAFPPAMVVVGGFDLLKDWQTRYVETLRGKGKAVRMVDYPDAIHGFHAFPELADSGKLMEEMKLFVQEHRSKRAV
ncbi:probable carboxylesterase 18 [Phragmites australis]|uniref:probable carboxylesterase 18 n=1 Tax=Phragmites australis TaxID=29695 RepID=UPI002D79C832|nr:probable carboxylesterase 18 [Phragmites australis]